MRRHIPATLALDTDPAVDGRPARRPRRSGRIPALQGHDRDRDSCAAIIRNWPSRAQPIEALVLKEASRYYNYLTLRYNLVSATPRASRSLLVRALDDKLERGARPHLPAAGADLSVEGRRRRAIHDRARRRPHPRRRRRVPGQPADGAVRKRVMPIIEDPPMEEKVRHANTFLKTRPRDLEDTLAQLVHDDDQVVAASAIHFVEQRQLWSLADDLEYSIAHRPAHDFASKPHRGRSPAPAVGARRDPWTESLPVVELADRCAPFRCSISCRSTSCSASPARAASRRTRRAARSFARAPSQRRAVPARGRVQLSGGEGAPRDVAAPTALAFEEMLEGARSATRPGQWIAP